MNADDEKILSRELREVASGLTIPPRPQMPAERRRIQHLGRPLLVAAAMIVVAAGGVAVLAPFGDDGGQRPAASPPVETPADEPTVRPLTADVPTVPFLFDGRMYVDGEQVPGTWLTMHQADGAWTAQRADNTWWWGTGADENPIAGPVVLQPRISPDGSLLAVATATREGGQVLLIDTRSGDTVDALQTSAEQGSSDHLGVVAVTDDAKVFLQSDSRRLMWLDGDETVDLATTAPEQWVQGSTSAGLIVFDGTADGESSATYLAEVSDAGEPNRLRTLPSDNVVVNPSGTWLGYGGSWGGEAGTIPEITAQRIDGSSQLRLPAPDDRELVAVTWEDDDMLLAESYSDGSPTGLARCSIREEACLAIDGP